MHNQFSQLFSLLLCCIILFCSKMYDEIIQKTNGNCYLKKVCFRPNVLFRHYSVIFDSVKAPFADTRVLNEPKNVRKVFPLFANIHHCSRSSDCLSKQRERVVYANCTISLYQTVSSATPPLPLPSSLLHAKQFQLDILLLLLYGSAVYRGYLEFDSSSVCSRAIIGYYNITIIRRTTTA